MARKVEQFAPESSVVDDTLPESGPGWQRRRSDASAIREFDSSRTEQHHKDSCDINVLMARYEKVGEVPRAEDGRMWFGDFTDVPDRYAAKAALVQAEASFMQLPAKVRSRFDNNPLDFLEYIDSNPDPEELRYLGLVAPVAAAPGPSPVSPPPAPPAAGKPAAGGEGA